MQAAADPVSHARALSQEADRLIGELHAAIRCLCCPDEPGSATAPCQGMFTRLVDDEAVGARRVLRRSDFLGLLAQKDIDAELGRPA
jgi:hypothetical protein